MSLLKRKTKNTFQWQAFYWWEALGPGPLGILLNPALHGSHRYVSLNAEIHNDVKNCHKNRYTSIMSISSEWNYICSTALWLISVFYPSPQAVPVRHLKPIQQTLPQIPLSPSPFPVPLPTALFPSRGRLRSLEPSEAPQRGPTKVSNRQRFWSSLNTHREGFLPNMILGRYLLPVVSISFSPKV